MSKRITILVSVVFLAALCFMGCGKSTPTTPVGGDTVAPAPVRDLQGYVTLTPATSVVLRWKESPEVDFAGYKVYRSMNNGSVEFVGTTGSANFSDGTVVGGSSYVYKVSAYDLSNNESTKASTGPVVVPSTSIRGGNQQD